MSQPHLISIHAPAGGATPTPEEIAKWRAISIHAPAGGATPVGPSRFLAYIFQFTPLREGRPTDQLKAKQQELFQFTPLREGRHARGSDGTVACVISIHAPAGGATQHFRENIRLQLISIHAPAGGATLFFRCFVLYSIIISIHAPAGGATLIDEQRVMLITIFQFTPLREGRHGPADKKHSTKNFNSRPCGRGDSSTRSAGCVVCSISIHAPAGGATVEPERTSGTGRISIHAPAGGATLVPS